MHSPHDNAPPQFSPAELEAYLDEGLPPDQMAWIERAIRTSPDLAEQLIAIHRRRDNGLHSLGEIWRRHRVSCPSREQLGAYLLQALSTDWADYIQFHIQEIGCRLCEANLADLQSQTLDMDHAASRRRRYFQSTAGYLKS